MDDLRCPRIHKQLLQRWLRRAAGWRHQRPFFRLFTHYQNRKSASTKNSSYSLCSAPVLCQLCSTVLPVVLPTVVCSGASRCFSLLDGAAAGWCSLRCSLGRRFVEPGCPGFLLEDVLLPICCDSPSPLRTAYSTFVTVYIQRSAYLVDVLVYEICCSDDSIALVLFSSVPPSSIPNVASL